MGELANQSTTIAAKRPKERQSLSFKRGSRLLPIFILLGLGLIRDNGYSSEYYLAISSNSIHPKTDDQNMTGNLTNTTSTTEEHPTDNPMNEAYVLEDRSQTNAKYIPKDNSKGNRTKGAYIPRDHSIGNRTNATSIHDDTISVGKYLFPLPPSRWVDDIDTSNPRCGAFKCAYDSKTNQYLDNDRRDDPNRYGYLVSQKIKSSYDFEATVHAYEKAQELAEKFSISHSLLAPPQMFVATTSFIEKLNENSAHSVPRKDNDEKKALQFVKKGKRDELFIQPIQLVPDGSLLFGCLKKYNTGLGRENLTESIAMRTSLLPVKELQKFEQRLRDDLVATILMLKSDEGRCMASQFQLFIDPNTGRFYHIDIERCFDGNENRIPKHFLCYKKLVEYANMLLQSKGGSKLKELPKKVW